MADTFLKSEFLFLPIRFPTQRKGRPYASLPQGNMWLGFFEESRTNGAKEKLEGRGRTFSETNKRGSPN